MKIIFLDIDGVLATHKSFREAREKGERGLAVQRALDPECVALLNRLCEETGAHIVLTSDWRRNEREVSVGFLRQGGVTGTIHEHWHTATIDENRGREIDDWLTALGHTIESYVILEDEAILLASHQLERAVITNTSTGFLAEHYVQALAVLDTPWRQPSPARTGWER